MVGRIIKGQTLYTVDKHGITEITIRTVTEDYFVGTDLETSQALLFTYDELDEVVFQDRDAAMSFYRSIYETRT